MTDRGAPPLGARDHMGGPTVSVVMPTYRRASLIGQTILSLLAQTRGDFELLVRDDGDGRDGTAEAVAAAAAGDPRVRYHLNARRLGMPGNLNAGIVAARGDLIAVCHDHDLYKPSFLAAMVETLMRHPTALFVHCAIDVITQSGAHVGSHIGEWPELSSGHSWVRFMLNSLHCPVCALTVVRRKAHEEHGLYDPAYGFIADVEMWMRLALRGDVAYVREPLVQVRERESDHWAAEKELAFIRTTADIHRRYIPEVYGFPAGLAGRLLLELRVLRATCRSRVSRIAKGSAWFGVVRDRERSECLR